MTVGIFSGFCMSSETSALMLTMSGHGPRADERKRRTPLRSAAFQIHADATYAEKDDPQPQPPVAFGFLKVKPEPCIEVV